jgi:hypothetical protein
VQVVYEDSQWDTLKLLSSTVQVFDGLPCGTQSNGALPHIKLPNGPLSSGTPSRKRAQATCGGAEGSPSEDETRSEADPDEQPAVVRVCRQATSAQTGAPFESVEGTPAGPVVHCSSHRSVQKRISPAAELTTASGKEPDPPALAQHANSAPGNYMTHQEANPCTMVEDRPASSLLNINSHFDRWLERYQHVYTSS